MKSHRLIYTRWSFMVLITVMPILSCTAQKETQKNLLPTANEQLMEPATLPVLRINTDTFTNLEDLHFKHSVGGKAIKEETLVMVKYDDRYLEVMFDCRDNPFMDQNHYEKDNSPMFRQEVFEIFISMGKEPMEDYIEIQLNPNNALFLAKINNRFKSDGKVDLTWINTKTAGVVHSVTKDQAAQSWSGHLKIPWDILHYPQKTTEPVFRLNFYRIISQKPQSTKNWRGTANNSTYACWSSTMARKPQFHRPEFFGYLILD